MNFVCLTGTVGRKPEIHRHPDGGTVTRIALGCDQEEGREWFRVHVKTAKNDEKTRTKIAGIGKDSKIMVSGVLRSRSYEGPDKTRHHIVYVEAGGAGGIEIVSLPDIEVGGGAGEAEKTEKNPKPDFGGEEAGIDQIFLEVRPDN